MKDLFATGESSIYAFEVLAHEMVHAGSVGEEEDGFPKGLRFISKNREHVETKGVSYDEIFTERLASWICFGSTENEARRERVLEGNGGYPEVTFVLDLLKEAIGIDEASLIAISHGGRKKFDDMIKSVQERYRKIDRNVDIEGIETQADVIFGIHYGEEKDILTDQEKLINYDEAINNMYVDTLRCFNARYIELFGKVGTRAECMEQYINMQRSYYNIVETMKRQPYNENALVKDVHRQIMDKFAIHYAATRRLNCVQTMRRASEYYMSEENDLGKFITRERISSSNIQRGQKKARSIIAGYGSRPSTRKDYELGLRNEIIRGYIRLEFGEERRQAIEERKKKQKEERKKQKEERKKKQEEVREKRERKRKIKETEEKVPENLTILENTPTLADSLQKHSNIVGMPYDKTSQSRGNKENNKYDDIDDR